VGANYNATKRQHQAAVQEKISNQLNKLLYLDAANEQKNQVQISTMKTILEKPSHKRTPDELADVVKLIKANKFFAEKNIKE